VPAPPDGFTPALASVVLEGSASRRTVAAGLMQLTCRGLISFREEPMPVIRRSGIAVTTMSRRERALPDPERRLMEAIKIMGGHRRYVDSALLGALSDAFGAYTRSLDAIAAQQGWVRASPDVTIRRWRRLAGAEFLAGLFLLGWLSRLVSDAVDPWGVFFVGLGLAASGVVTFFVSGAMPVRTLDGARLAAMLKAYRRTLQATIAQARSLAQVVDARPLPWVYTAEEEVAWAVAFGLDRDVDRLLDQSLEVSETGGWPKGLRDWFSIV
jgi:hypothetical protein